MSKLSSFRTFFKVLVINILVFFFIFAALESVTRVAVALMWGETAYLKYGFKYSKTDFSHVGPLYYQDKGDYLAFRHMTHPKVNWAEGPVYINQHGFRGKDFSIEKPSGVYRILTMGESSTFGFHVSDNKAWPFLLNEKFKKTNLENKKVEVINLGLPWYNSQDNLNLLNFALKLKPDLVIYYGAANDVVDLSLPKLRAQSIPVALQYISQTESYSLFLYKFRIFLQTKFHKVLESVQSDGANVYVDAPVIQDGAVRLFITPFEMNMKSFRDKLRDNNTKFILVKQIRAPLGRDWFKQRKEEGKYNDELRNFEQDINTTNFYSYYEQLSQKLVKENRLNLIETVQYMHARLIAHLDTFAKENNIVLVDFVKDIKGDFKLLTTDLHLTEQGNEALADDLFNFITH